METLAPGRGNAEQILRNLARSGDTALMYVDGRWCEASNGNTRKLIDPATGATIATVAEGTRDDARRAIESARRAFDEGPWSAMTAHDRARLLMKLA
ncbi:MAG: aldehyde dehydrogenase family protein, partial [Candidatus Baltobacteraceae bacterium]